MKLIWTQKSKSQIRRIYSFYSEKVSVAFARRIISSISNKPKILLQQPNLGQRENLLREINPDLRYLIEGNFKLIYLVEKNKIIIVSVFDTRQDPLKIKDL